MNELNAQFPINRLGYGIAGLNLLHHLSKKTRLNLFPIGNVEITNPNIQASVQNAIDNTASANLDAPTIKLWHQHALLEHVGRGKYYGFPIFELDKFTEPEQLNLSCPHELIVCSNWAKEICEEYTSKPVHVVPLGVDRDIFFPGAEQRGRTYKFFTIGKWEYRKGHDIIIECFNKAFEQHDDVELHLATFNPFLQGQMEFKTNEWASLAKQSKLGDKTFLYGPLGSHSDVAYFIRRMECGLFPSRAEGWNLELLESMASDKPVITTHYSAHTQYCTPENSFLIDVTLTEEANDGIWFHGQGSWAFIGQRQKTQMVDYMRHCYKNRPDNKAGIRTAIDFSWENSANRLLNVISV